MATIRSYTTVEQSRKLAEILPLESADMYWKNGVSDKYIQCFTPFVIDDCWTNVDFNYDVPCWSLTSLLGVMICPKLEEYIEGVWDLIAFTDNTLKTPIEIQDYKEPIDACYEMILKLNELKML